MGNRINLAVALALVALASVAPAVAQQPPTQPRPQVPATPATANVPVSKMAVIYSEAFQDSNNGIARFNTTLNKLNGEFQKMQDDLNQTSQRLKGLQEEINNPATAQATPPK